MGSRDLQAGLPITRPGMQASSAELWIQNRSIAGSRHRAHWPRHEFEVRLDFGARVALHGLPSRLRLWLVRCCALRMWYTVQQAWLQSDDPTVS
jgi:hypothetical protein